MKTLMPLKMLAMTALLSTLVSAKSDFELHGQITAVDSTNTTITISGMHGASIDSALYRN